MNFYNARVGKDHLEMNYGIGAVGVAVVALHPYLFNFLGILGAVLATSLSFASVSRTAPHLKMARLKR